MKVGKGSGEDSVEKKEKDLGPSKNLHNVKISRNLKSFERRNDNISLEKEGIENNNKVYIQCTEVRFPVSFPVDLLL